MTNGIGRVEGIAVDWIAGERGLSHVKIMVGDVPKCLKVPYYAEFKLSPFSNNNMCDSELPRNEKSPFFTPFFLTHFSESVC